MRIAKVKWPGQNEFSAELVREREDGSMLMRAMEKGNRFVVWSDVVVQPREITSWVEVEDAESPP